MGVVGLAARVSMRGGGGTRSRPRRREEEEGRWEGAAGRGRRKSGPLRARRRRAGAEGAGRRLRRASPAGSTTRGPDVSRASTERIGSQRSEGRPARGGPERACAVVNPSMRLVVRSPHFEHRQQDRHRALHASRSWRDAGTA